MPGDSCRVGSQIGSSDTSSLAPEVTESEAAETGDIESPENGPAEALVPDIETAETESEPDRMRSPSAAQRGTKCLSEYYYLVVICLFVNMVL